LSADVVVVVVVVDVVVLSFVLQIVVGVTVIVVVVNGSVEGVRTDERHVGLITHIVCTPVDVV
jgi:hypothetical protein